MRHLWCGDSILEGMAPHIERMYREHAGTGRAKVVSNGGWSTRKWLREGGLRGLVGSFHPDLVVICLGTNDEGEERTPTGYRRTVASLREIAGSGGAKVMWISSFGGDGSGARYRIVQSVVGESATVRGDALMGGLERATDGIHPARDAYGVLAGRCISAVWTRMASVGSSGEAAAVIPLGLGLGLGLAALVWWA